MTTKLNILLEIKSEAFLNQYSVLFDEIMMMNLSQLEAVITDMKAVLEGRSVKNRFTGEVVSVCKYDPHKASIYVYDELVGEESTADLYQILTTYRSKLLDNV